MSGDDARPIFVPPGAGLELASLAVTHKLTTDQTGGACYVFESTFEPGMANRLHVHRDADEIGYVLEGALEIRIEGQRRVLEAGGLARLPKRIPHALRNPTQRSARYLFIAIPGGLDRWFEAIERGRRAGSLDDATAAELAREHGIDWLE